MIDHRETANRRSSKRVARLLLPIIVLVGGESVSASPLAAAEGPLRVGIATGDQILWVFERRPGVDGVAVVRFAYRSLDPTTASRFYGIPNAVTGRPARLAVRGRDLHVFFGDGTHRRFTAPTRSPRSWAASTPFVEQKLTRASVVPTALAGDGIGNVLFAITSRAVAADLIASARLDELDDPSPDGERPAKAAPAADVTPVAGSKDQGPPSDTLPSDTLPSDAFPMDAAPSAVRPMRLDDGIERFIVRYDEGVWVVDRAAPADATQQAAIIQLAARDGAVHLFYRVAEGRPLVHRASASCDDPWSTPVELPVSSDVRWSSVGWRGEEPVLVLGESHSEGTVVRTCRFSQGAWIEGAELTDGGGMPATFPGLVSAGAAGAELIVAHSTVEGGLHVGTWSIESGEPLQEAAPVAPMQWQPADAGRHTLRIIVQYVILASALGAVFVWRRDSVIRTDALAGGLTHARLSYRMIALFIDGAILMPVWASLLYMLFFPQDGSPSIVEQVQLNRENLSPAVYWSPAIVGGLFAIYGTVFEHLMGATPGKRIAGLSVVGEGGSPRSFGSILVRNLARVVEFKFYPLALLVVLTPNRQRLGDLLGRTIVVEPSTST